MLQLHQLRVLLYKALGSVDSDQSIPKGNYQVFRSMDIRLTAIMKIPYFTFLAVMIFCYQVLSLLTLLLEII